METVKFEELGLYPQLLRAIKEMGFEEATPIQSQAIPVVMSGVDTDRNRKDSFFWNPSFDESGPK